MWWNTQPRLYQKELNLLRQNFPGLNVGVANTSAKYCAVCADRDARKNPHLAAFAQVSTALGGKYPIIMVYPCSYPHRIPSVWPLVRLKPTPPSHQYSDGRLCLTSNENDPSINGCIVLSWAFGWFNCYDLWRKTGCFPDKNYSRHRV